MGVGQGRKLSPNIYNIGTISQTVSSDSDISAFADDSFDIVHGNTIAECNENMRKVVEQRTKWFKNIGLTLNVGKTELIGFGFSPSPVTIAGQLITPVDSVKFLGFHLQANLKCDEHINYLRNKLRSASGRIRTEGRHLDIHDRRILFNGWVLGSLHSNGLAYLPNMTKADENALQSAFNAGIRAVAGFPKYGYVPVTETRRKLGIPSLNSVKNRVLTTAAWKRFHESSLTPFSGDGPVTRNRKNCNLPLPNQTGHEGKITENVLIPVWNSLPLETKQIRKIDTFKKTIKRTHI